MKNIVLIGMMGCGKTTVGRLLAQQLGRELTDTDALIEQREGRAIPDIFSTDGEARFRELELALCRELAPTRGLVIACGGGLPLREDCIGPLRDNGVVFWLDRDPGDTYDALDLSHRPLAQQGRDAFIARYRQRRPVYQRAAHHTIAAPTPQAAAAAIMAILKQEEAQP